MRGGTSWRRRARVWRLLPPAPASPAGPAAVGCDWTSNGVRRFVDADGALGSVPVFRVAERFLLGAPGAIGSLLGSVDRCLVRVARSRDGDTCHLACVGVCRLERIRRVLVRQ